MLSQEIESRLIQLFKDLAEGEKTIEISRKILSDSYDFDAYQIYINLDLENKGRIDSLDIVRYLGQKNMYSTDQEAQLVILFYDKDYDGLLDYEEFKNLIQSKSSINKISPSIQGQALKINIDISLTILLQKEILLARKLLDRLTELKSRTNFNIHDAFHSIKNYNGVDIVSIRNLFLRNNASYIDSDLPAIIRRLDINKDNIVDFCEFHSFFGFPECSYNCPLVACKYCGACYCSTCFCSNTLCRIHGRIHQSIHSPKRSPIRNEYRKEKYLPEQKQLETPDLTSKNELPDDNIMIKTRELMNAKLPRPNEKLRISQSPPPDKKLQKVSNSLSVRLSPQRRYGPENCGCSSCEGCNYMPNNHEALNNQNRYEDNIKENDEYNEKQFLFSREPKDKNNYLPPPKNLPNTKQKENSLFFNPYEYEEKQFVCFLKYLMDIENNAELMKIRLCQKRDFNVEDTFRIFESQGRGYLTIEDLAYGFSTLGVDYSDKDLKIILNRFGLKKKGQINFADFFDMVVPFEVNCRNVLEYRPPNLSTTGYNNIKEFSRYTVEKIKNLFFFYIDQEKKINEMKKGCNSLRRCSKHIFGLIDDRKDGYFIEDDLNLYLRKNGIFSNDIECSLLFIRLNKFKNGKIQLVELDYELNPVI